MNLNLLRLIAIGVLVIWGIMLAKFKKLSKILALIGAVVATYAVFSYTVIGRTPSSNHTFSFFSPSKYELGLEMFMNALLYIPFGMTFSVLLGCWTILIAFVLSLLIEFWQYRMGTGFAQGTDVIMNTLGAFIGSIPYIVIQYRESKK